jgi:four helix bundle protein
MDKNISTRSFTDLEVYKNSYQASLQVIRKIVPKLPREKRDDLADQLRRAAKAVPRLIAEGYAKRHQRSGFQKYLHDALAESNELYEIAI